MVQYPTNFGDESMTDREDFIPRAQVRSSRTMRRLTTLDPIPFGPYKGTVMMDLPRRYVEHLARQSWLHHDRPDVAEVVTRLLATSGHAA
jgi:uncharacterized protein (DUF3820 family)